MWATLYSLGGMLVYLALRFEWIYGVAAVVTVFHAPRSYTGETLVEMAAHGAPVVLEAMVRGALVEGARARRDARAVHGGGGAGGVGGSGEQTSRGV